MSSSVIFGSIFVVTLLLSSCGRREVGRGRREHTGNSREYREVRMEKAEERDGGKCISWLKNACCQSNFDQIKQSSSHYSTNGGKQHMTIL